MRRGQIWIDGTHLHSHVGDDRSGLTLNDTLHNVLHMVATCGDHAFGLRDLAVRITGEEHLLIQSVNLKPIISMLLGDVNLPRTSSEPPDDRPDQS